MPEFVELVIGLHRREQGGGIAAGLLSPAPGHTPQYQTCASESPCKTRTRGAIARSSPKSCRHPARLPPNNDFGIIEQRQHQRDRPCGVDPKGGLARGTPCFRVRSGQSRKRAQGNNRSALGCIHLLRRPCLCPPGSWGHVPGPPEKGEPLVDSLCVLVLVNRHIRFSAAERHSSVARRSVRVHCSTGDTSHVLVGDGSELVANLKEIARLLLRLSVEVSAEAFGNGNHNAGSGRPITCEDTEDESTRRTPQILLRRRTVPQNHVHPRARPQWQGRLREAPDREWPD